jgi:hypothetical protein
MFSGSSSVKKNEGEPQMGALAHRENAVASWDRHWEHLWLSWGRQSDKDQDKEINTDIGTKDKKEKENKERSHAPTATEIESSSSPPPWQWWRIWQVGCTYARWLVSIGLVWLVASRSVPVVQNLMAVNGAQAMNTSFDAFRLVNTYGAFGSITKIRHEVILEGGVVTQSSRRKGRGGGAGGRVRPEDISWLEFEYPCKPGNINRRPCLISPYHYRMDWLMWFAAFQSYQQCPWLVHHAYRLLQVSEEAHTLALTQGQGQRQGQGAVSGSGPSSNDLPLVMSLLSHEGSANEYLIDMIQKSKNRVSSEKDKEDEKPPITFIRARLYEYQYNYDGAEPTSGSGSSEVRDGWERGVWWKRKYARDYMPPISLSDPGVLRFLQHSGWA